jgi:hypothetical protein
MNSILSLLDESGLIWDGSLSNNQIVEIYKSTTEEEAVQYMETIQDLLDKQIVPERISELCMAVSYLNIEAFVYKNWYLQSNKK